MANKSVKRTSQNSALPPLKYEVIDSFTNGNNKYELRELNSGKAIYLYSNRTRSWSVYRKTETEQKWKEMTNE